VAPEGVRGDQRPGGVSDLEDEAQSQIEALEESLPGPAVPGETFIEKVGRLRMARFQAEEQVVREVFLPEPDAPCAEED